MVIVHKGRDQVANVDQFLTKKCQAGVWYEAESILLSSSEV